MKGDMHMHSKKKDSATKAPIAKASIFSSIRGKLLVLGCVSIATTVILGFTGIYLINSSNSNNQVLADINQINLLQNENQTLDVSFLYDLDTSYNDTKMDNLKQMSSAAENALKYTKSGFRSDLKEISDDIDTTISNSSDLFSSISERGFSKDSGMYADFIAPDEALDLSSLTAADLSKSYGEGYSDLDVTTFNNVPSISFQGTFTSANPDWQEASIEIPIADSSFDVCQKATVDLYFEETQLPTVRAAIALNGKYDFGSSLEQMVQSTNETSSQIDLAITGIADGANNQAEDVEQSTHQITDLGNFMDDMVSNVGELDSTSAHMKEASDEALQILNGLSVSNQKTTDGINKISDLIHTTNNSVQEIKEAVSTSPETRLRSSNLPSRNATRSSSM